MTISVRHVELPDIASLRDAFRAEMNCQIVHDSIHVRPGWTREFLLADGDSAIGYGSVAVEGQWQNRQTVYDIYVMPEQRSRAFPLFEAFLAESVPQAFEVQTSDTLTTAMCLTFARDIGTEGIVFRDHVTTAHTIAGATLKRVTYTEEIQTAIA